MFRRFSGERYTFCVPPSFSNNIFCTAVCIFVRISNERFTFCVPPPCPAAIFQEHISDARSASRMHTPLAPSHRTSLVSFPPAQSPSPYHTRRSHPNLSRLNPLLLVLAPTWARLVHFSVRFALTLAFFVIVFLSRFSSSLT